MKSTILEAPILIPPHGHVAYVRHLGSDQAIVDAARVSYLAESKGEEKDRKLLNYLYCNRHTSPFEQSSITFNIKFPIFLMRQFVRQRTFRLNEFSGRYSELPDEFYYPPGAGWRFQNDSGNKQGSHLPAHIDQEWHDINTGIADEAYIFAYEQYKLLLARKVAKEQARMVLPVGIYTQIVVSCDMHNLTNFLRQRLDPHAQAEIGDVAKAMAQIADELFPWTMAAFRRFEIAVIDEATCLEKE